MGDWKKFFVTFREEVKKDQITNLAAAVAYFLLFSLFPAVIFLLSLLPYLPISGLEAALKKALLLGIPRQSAQLLQKVIEEVMAQQKGGLLSLGLLLTIFAGSNCLHVIIEELNFSYKTPENRPWWKIRLTAVLLFFLIILLIIGAFTLIIFGEILQSLASSYFGFGPIWEMSFTFLRWIIIAVLILLSLAFIYYFAPCEKHEFRSIIPGSTLGTIFLLMASLPFSYYVDNFTRYDVSYGSLGAVIILLFWLYVVGLILLLCGKFNALTRRKSP